MKPKKIFILAYAKANLGDDLFIYMLLKKYPHTLFYINIENEENAKLFKNFSNITIYSEKEKVLTKQNANQYDGYIYIGGSIFMEGGVVYNITEQFLEFMKECKKNNIPFCYVSSNFGPYYTEEYLNLAKEVFKNCTSISFRDKYSANLFKDISTVHYLPDLAFSYVPENIEKIKNTVGISVIDLSIRNSLSNKEQCYYKMLEKNVKQYILQGKKVTLFSFCKYEGDERAIKAFLNGLPEEYAKQINIVKYDGNINEFLKEYSKMEYMVCARFHAMILSVVFGQKCEIMSYSNKIENVIDDLKLFTGNVVSFNNLTANLEMPLENFKNVEEENLKKIVLESKKQLSSVDEILQTEN